MPDSTPLSHRFEDAFAFAARLHRTQVRKGTTIPYIAHLMAVSALVLEFGGTEDEAIAALLHDGPEDQGGLRTLQEIRTRFGDRVADLVAGCSDTYEDEKPEWRPRKEAYIAHVATLDPGTLMVSIADKLHNARAILADVTTTGDAVWERFSGKRHGTLWYYRALVDAYRARQESAILDALDQAVAQLEEAAAGAR